MKDNVLKIMTPVLSAAILLLAGLSLGDARGAETTPAEARAIAKEA